MGVRAWAPSVALVATLVACRGNQGTLKVGLLFPGGKPPHCTVQVRLSVDNPPLVQTVPVAADGSFNLALEFDGQMPFGRVTVAALDAAGSVLARGSSPPVSLDGDAG